MLIAITGANGHFGKTLVELCQKENHEVRLIDYYKTAKDVNEPFLKIDVTDLGSVVSAFHGCEAVIHLAAFPSPNHHSDATVYHNNTIGSYNILFACELLGIEKICMASSINAIGGVYSRKPKYDYFPVDEQHKTYNEDPYSLSKWILEHQGDCFARRRSTVSISSMRFHWIQRREFVLPHSNNEASIKHLWAYSDPVSSAKACLLSLNVKWKGHEAFFIVAPQTASEIPSKKLYKEFYPDVELRKPFDGFEAFYNSSKAEDLLDWNHEDHSWPKHTEGPIV